MVGTGVAVDGKVGIGVSVDASVGVKVGGSEIGVGIAVASATPTGVGMGVSWANRPEMKVPIGLVSERYS